jgi:hypothetical protein
MVTSIQEGLEAYDREHAFAASEVLESPPSRVRSPARLAVVAHLRRRQGPKLIGGGCSR